MPQPTLSLDSLPEQVSLNSQSQLISERYREESVSDAIPDNWRYDPEAIKFI